LLTATHRFQIAMPHLTAFRRSFHITSRPTGGVFSHSVSMVNALPSH
jgi:hypothetical protein